MIGGILEVVSLAVGFWDKHGDSIIGVVDRAIGTWEKTTEEQSEILHAIARNQEQLKRTIKQSTEILGTLIKSQSLAIINNIEQNRARNAIDDLKAGVTAMKAILVETNISKELTGQFVTQHLMPVRHYMIKASNILDEFEDKNLVSCCRIVGLTALVAGYEYMGQNVDTGLKKELGDELLVLQKRMLTQYARSILLRGEDFDWEKVTEMLSPKGAKELAQRFIEIGDSEPDKKIDKLPDPRGMVVTKALKVIATISDLETLAHFVGLEFLSHNDELLTYGFSKRQRVLEACIKKWDELDV